jgi:hypothetical protein
MLGPSGKLLIANLFFEQEPAVVLVTLWFPLEELFDRDAAIGCHHFARIAICSLLVGVRGFSGSDDSSFA